MDALFQLLSVGIVCCITLIGVIIDLRYIKRISRRLDDLDQKWLELDLCCESLIDEIELMRVGGDPE